jgi:ferrous iron transport protein B
MTCHSSSGPGRKAGGPSDITIALAGNPNAGKSTVFNNLTGARQHVGNWPGVTVEKKEGYCTYKGRPIKVVDLPGVYSLTAYSLDEVIARDFIVDERPDVVVNIVDASNLERNLYLTVQLLEMGVKLIIGLNMMDVAASRGYRIDTEALAGLLGAAVVPLVAARNQGTAELLEAIEGVANGNIVTRGADIRYGHDVESEIVKLEKLIAANSVSDLYPARWLAVKLLEQDEQIIDKIKRVAVG